MAGAVLVSMGEAEMSQEVDQQADIVNGDRKRQAVTFLTSDGKSYEGVMTRSSGEIIFIQSKKMVPVGQEITVDVTPVDGSGRESVVGTVVWQCFDEDEFGNLAGFGVRLHRRSAGGLEPENIIRGPEDRKEAT
jgi:Tfp pilus assembly protein PilZ